VIHPQGISKLGDDAPAVLLEMQDLMNELSDRGPLESLHEARTLLSEAHSHYAEGRLNLDQRARAEQMFYAALQAIGPLLDTDIRAQREALDSLREQLSAKYFCNFSVFQSMPDAWAIDQVFPILPLHRLQQRPQIRARLCDLTCDSDGRLDRYVDREGLTPTLALHPLESDAPYLLGFFMVGAYQEILGDMHNLFGDTNAVNVVLDADAENGWRLEQAEHGDRADELLQYVHISPEHLITRYKEKVAASTIPEVERAAMMNELEEGLRGYTYLGSD
ncbi:MAG: arginine decarboxylase, partial [Panacagrimonas sp.]